jgi:transcriptional regulator with XRE-family HTH domain
MRKQSKPDIRERFGFAVKLRREELGLTQEELAERAGLHRTYLSDIERGTRNLSLINIERVAAALALRLSELFRLVEADGVR